MKKNSKITKKTNKNQINLSGFKMKKYKNGKLNFNNMK